MKYTSVTVLFYLLFGAGVAADELPTANLMLHEGDNTISPARKYGRWLMNINRRDRILSSGTAMTVRGARCRTGSICAALLPAGFSL